ncbi:unnamed protein product [Owenia fusiformis]|uniref:Uncharacterized protein n=1 Tax=Owenia fusiformis TaxID=6347 RepID=A0A8J1U172_OWEFU|nr:unnamed protein product [Owenia fusiformis]
MSSEPNGSSNASTNGSTGDAVNSVTNGDTNSETDGSTNVNPKKKLPPMFFVQGTYYDCGYQRGEFCKDVLKEFIDASEESIQRYQAFYETTDGKEFVDGFISNCTKRFPHLMDEFRGIYDGANIDMKKGYLMLLSPQLEDVLGNLESAVLEEYGCATKGCTDIYVNNDNDVIIGHNEDWALDFDWPFIIHSKIEPYTMPDGQVIPEQRLMALYPHPASFSSPSWINSHGLSGTDDVILFPKNKVYKEKKTPYQVLVRLQQQARSPEELIKLCVDEGSGVAYSWSVTLNFGVFGSSTMYNLEVGPSDGPRSKVSVKKIVPQCSEGDIAGAYAHFNHTKHLADKGTRCIMVNTRQAFYDSQPTPESLKDVLALLGNTKGDKYTIYMPPEKKGHWATNWSSVLDFKNKCMYVYVGNPTNKEPDIILPFSMLQTKK